MKRNVNLDVLRVLSMFMIIMLHLLGLNHGEVLSSTKDFSVHWFVGWFMEAFCSVAVNCYVLISGYFLVDAKFSWIKLVKLMFEVWFYSITIFLILLIKGDIDISINSLVSVVFPILNRSYWFISSYICLYILSPFINKFLLQLDSKEHRNLLMIVFVLFSVIPTFYPFEDTFLSGGGSGITWFIVLYLIASYVKRYSQSFCWNYKKYLCLYFIGSLLVSASKYCIALITHIVLHKTVGTSIFYGYNSPFVVISSVALFLYFERKPEIKCETSAFFKVASSTFGVYLIHDNPLLRPILWDLFNVNTEGNVILFIVALIVIVFIIFVVCVLIDLLRAALFSYCGVDRMINRLKFNRKGTD